MNYRLYLLIFVFVFFNIVFFLRSYLLWKNTRINPIVFATSDDAHGVNGKLFKLMAIIEFIVILIYSLGGDWYAYLLPFWYLEKTYLSIPGWVLLHGSLIWIFVAQLQMANSWRIGIDFQHPTQLVTKGLFSISRNPIFLGVLLANLGLFLVIPNAFTLLISVWSFTVIQIQVRLEEAFLKETHGKMYATYCKNINRWF